MLVYLKCPYNALLNLKPGECSFTQCYPYPDGRLRIPAKVQKWSTISIAEGKALITQTMAFVNTNSRLQTLTFILCFLHPFPGFFWFFLSLPPLKAWTSTQFRNYSRGTNVSLVVLNGKIILSLVVLPALELWAGSPSSP